jgi:predicted O-methyltransferase YrrM
MSVFLDFLKWRLGLAKVEAVTTAGEAACLARHASGKKRLAEIGVWQGGTTKRLRSVMAPDATLVAIDPFPKGQLGFSTHRTIARSEVARVPNGRVEWVRQTSTDAAANAHVRACAPFDFVFLDALHTYDGLREDWNAWAPLVAPAGIIAIHDSRATPGGHSEDVGGVRFTREVVTHDPRFDIVDEVDSLTVLRRKV